MHSPGKDPEEVSDNERNLPNILSAINSVNHECANQLSWCYFLSKNKPKAFFKVASAEIQESDKRGRKKEKQGLLHDQDNRVYDFSIRLEVNSNKISYCKFPVMTLPGGPGT